MQVTITIDDILTAARELAREQRGNNGGGMAPRPLCGAGRHDMGVHGRQVWKRLADGRVVKNGRYCIGCKRERQRAPGASERVNAQKPRTKREGRA